MCNTGCIGATGEGVFEFWWEMRRIICDVVLCTELIHYIQYSYSITHLISYSFFQDDFGVLKATIEQLVDQWSNLQCLQ